MTNHDHLVVTPDHADGLAKAVGRTNFRYAQALNRERSWSGNLWQNWFASSALDDVHFWRAVRHFERNPVRAVGGQRACGLLLRTAGPYDVAMQSKAATVEQYLAELPADRREAIEAVRRVILDNVDKGIEEGMYYGMICYYVPHRIFPAGYHCDPRIPLPFAGLASQKQYMSLYVMTAYGEGGEDSWLRDAWAKTGKKLDMGKCCIRFKKLDDLPLEVVGGAIRRVPVAAYIAYYEHQMESMGRKPARSTAKSGSNAKAVTSQTAGGRRTVAAAGRREAGRSKTAGKKTTVATAKRTKTAAAVKRTKSAATLARKGSARPNSKATRSTTRGGA